MVTSVARVVSVTRWMVLSHVGYQCLRVIDVVHVIHVVREIGVTRTMRFNNLIIIKQHISVMSVMQVIRVITVVFPPTQKKFPPIDSIWYFWHELRLA